jgi:hypothetical protein
MSSDASGWVWRFSPYKGSVFAVHQAIADTANDQNNNELWLSQSKLATKARVSRRAVLDALATLQSDGFIRRLGGGKETGTVVRYEFLFPRHLPVVYETRRGYADSAHPSADSAQGGVNGLRTNSRRTQEELSPRGETSSPPMLEVVKAEPSVAQRLVARYVEDYRVAHAGRSPSSAWRKQAGGAVKQALADKEPPDVIEKCLYAIAHEGRQPGVLNHVLSDYWIREAAQA